MQRVLLSEIGEKAAFWYTYEILHQYTFPSGGGEAERRLTRFAAETPHPLDAVQKRLEAANAREVLTSLSVTDRALVAANARSNTITTDITRVQTTLLTGVKNEFKHLTTKTPPMTPDAALAHLREIFQPIVWMRFELNAGRTDLQLSTAAAATPSATAPGQPDPLGSAHGILDYTDGLNGKKPERSSVNPERANQNRGLLVLSQFANSGGSIVGTVSTEDAAGKIYTIGMDGDNYLTQYRFQNGRWEVHIDAKDGRAARWESDGRNPDVPKHNEAASRNPAMAAKINALTAALLQANAEIFPANDSGPAYLQLRRAPPREVYDTSLIIRSTNEEIARLRTEGQSRVPTIGVLLRYVTELQDEEMRRIGLMETVSKSAGTTLLVMNDTLRLGFPASASEEALARIPDRLKDCAAAYFEGRSGNSVTLRLARNFWTGNEAAKLQALATLHTGTDNLQGILGTAPPPPPEQPRGPTPEQMARQTDEMCNAVITAFDAGRLPDIAVCTAAQNALQTEERAVVQGTPRAKALADLKLKTLSVFACVGLVRTYGESQAQWEIVQQPAASRADLMACSEAFDRERGQLLSVKTVLTRPGGEELANKALNMIGLLVADAQSALTARENFLFRRTAALRERMTAMPVTPSAPAAPSAPGTSPEQQRTMPEGLPDPRGAGSTEILKSRARTLWLQLNRAHPFEGRDPAVQARLDALDAYERACTAEKSRRDGLVAQNIMMPGLSASLTESSSEDRSTLTVTYPQGTDLTALREALSVRQGGTATLNGNALSLQLPGSFWQDEPRALMVIASFKDFVQRSPAAPRESTPENGVLAATTDRLAQGLEQKLQTGRHAQISYNDDLEALAVAARAEMAGDAVSATSPRGTRLLSLIALADRLKPMARARQLYQNCVEAKEEIRVAKRSGRNADSIRGQVRNAIQETNLAIAEANACSDELSLFLGGISKRSCIANLRADLIQYQQKDLIDPLADLRKEKGEAYLQQLISEGALTKRMHQGVESYCASFLLGVDKFYFSFFPDKSSRTPFGSWHMKNNKSDVWFDVGTVVKLNHENSYRHVEEKHQPITIARRLLDFNQERF